MDGTPGALPRTTGSRNPLEHSIDREVCFELLSAVPVARIGICLRALPVILPVNFVVTHRPGTDDPVVVIRSSEGSKFNAALHNSIVALEADGYDALSHAGWSVLVQGRSRVIDDPDEVDWAEQLPVQPWVDHQASHYIAINADVVQGRRFGLPFSPRSAHSIGSGHHR